MKINRSHAVSVAADAFRSYGISDADAKQTAKVLVSADARGKHSHGLLRLPRFIRGIEHGNVIADGDITLDSTEEATATLNGGSRLGPVVASVAVDEAMSRANEFGISAIGVHNSNHLAILGYYTDQIQREGYIGIAMTNTEPAMPPYGGIEPVLGTNPIAIGLPTDPVFNLDMSTSAIARGTIAEKQQASESIPEDVALDAAGDPTTDPTAALNGTILPFGGAKGSGLAIAVEILAGGLVDASMGRNVTGTYHTENPCTKGDLFIVIDPTSLASQGGVNRMSSFLQQLKQMETGTNEEKIRLPGERSVSRDRSREQIDIPSDLWETVRQL